MESTKTRCIIHIETYDNDPRTLVTLKDYNSCLVLLDTAQVRNHAPILQIAEGLHEHEVPNICYHRQCKSGFTPKKDLENLKNNQMKNLMTIHGVVKPQGDIIEGHPHPVFQPVCIFCGKDKCFKGTSTQ